jgi:membrane-associated phospholipid phosphatase
MSEPDASLSATAPRRTGRLSRTAAEAARLDSAVYSVIAATPTPTLDRSLQRLSLAANYSRLSIASAAVLALAAGRPGRDAAKMGLASIAVTSAALNLGVKPFVRRRRPDPVAQDVPVSRRLRMPSSTAFPSGHSASAFAFATGVGQVLPGAAVPLRGLAALVAYSRVHTGVHYPADALAGSLLGGALAQLTTRALAAPGREGDRAALCSPVVRFGRVSTR